MTGIRRLIDLSGDLYRADEPLAGGSKNQVDATGRRLGIGFDGVICAGIIQSLDRGADIRKMQRGARRYGHRARTIRGGDGLIGGIETDLGQLLAFVVRRGG